jgi:hypothetical protein
MMPWDAPLTSFWVRPADLTERDLFDGPWGPEYAPDPRAEYEVVSPGAGRDGTGLVVADGRGQKWHVSQAPNSRYGNGSFEVVLSRALSALGYHQPPVYFLPAFTLRDASGIHREPGGCFRRESAPMTLRGEWTWQQNPFVGMRPYQGLLVVLLLFNASDLDNSGNGLYDVARGGDTVTWYVVRDLRAVLGGARGLAADSDPDAFALSRFIAGVDGDFVEFDYRGSHTELLSHRISRDDVGWASFLLAGLSGDQWQDAFRAGGYAPQVAAQFIAALHDRIAQGRQIGGDDWP